MHDKTLFMIYVPKIKLGKMLIFALCLSPLVFYFGVRLTPSLNPENQIWGSFNWQYALEYADWYQFGEKEQQQYTYSISRLLTAP